MVTYFIAFICALRCKPASLKHMTSNTTYMYITYNSLPVTHPALFDHPHTRPEYESNPAKRLIRW